MRMGTGMKMKKEIGMEGMGIGNGPSHLPSGPVAQGAHQAAVCKKPLVPTHGGRHPLVLQSLEKA